MASIGIRLAEDQEDFWCFGITDDGITTQTYRGVAGLHRLLGDLRARTIQLLERYLASTRIRMALHEMSADYWLVIDIDANAGRHLTFASDQRVYSEYRYPSIADIMAAIERMATPPSP